MTKKRIKKLETAIKSGKHFSILWHPKAFIPITLSKSKANIFWAKNWREHGQIIPYPIN